MRVHGRDGVYNHPSYKLNKIEEQNAILFKKEHSRCHSLFKYKKTGTSVGTQVKVWCCKCGKIRDITDYDCW